jgi:hypothetical protein
VAQVEPDAPEGGTVRIALDGVGTLGNAVPTMATPKTPAKAVKKGKK